jgi:hypothetical protein
MAKGKLLSEFELKPTADNAAAVVDDHLAPIPCSRDAVFYRVDQILRAQGRALVAMQLPQANVLDAPEFDVFEVEMRDGGTVTKVEVIKRGTALGCLDLNIERPVIHWMGTFMP